MLASLAISLASLTTPAAAQGPVVPGCEKVDLSNPVTMQGLVNAHGLKNFVNPPEPAAPPTDAANRLDLVIDYANLTDDGCPAPLPTYNGAIVGPTIRAKPGDTIHLRLINQLPTPSAPTTHPQQPEPAGHGGGHGHTFSFNLTNLHTHGLNVAPQGPVDKT